MDPDHCDPKLTKKKKNLDHCPCGAWWENDKYTSGSYIYYMGEI